MFNKGFIWLAIISLFMCFTLLGCVETDLKYIVPSTDMYKTTAYQLSSEEVEKAIGSGFFSYVEKFIKIEKRSNPITIDGKEIEKVPPTNPNVQPFKNVTLFRSCFYNSEGHDLSLKTGLFASQALLFSNKTAADTGEQNLSKDWRKHYKVVLRKGNVVGAINMYTANAKPTKEFWELVNFAKENGFKVANATTAESLPDYSKWQTHVAEKVNDKLLKQVYLDDNMPPKQMVAEFIFDDGKTQQSELLIWTEYIYAEQNQTRMINRFYVRIEKPGKWHLVDISIFDVHTLPPGKKVNLFFNDSDFGKAFFALYSKAGIPKENVQVPSVTHTK